MWQEVTGGVLFDPDEMWTELAQIYASSRPYFIC